MDSFKDKELQEWSNEQVCAWIKERFNDDDIAKRFKEEEITGEVLVNSERITHVSTMELLGLKTIGKQETFIKMIKSYRDAKQTKEPVLVPKWKKKISNSDKTIWTPEQRALYNTKTSVIINASKKVWPGNQKVIFKGNEKNTLKLEEMVKDLESTCVIEEVGFRKDAIRKYIIQWAQEKNRRISDGYDFEKEHKRAKRARPSASSSTSTSTGSEDHDTELESDTDGYSNNLKDLTLHSPKVAILVLFNAASFAEINLRKHLIPLAKELKVKSRSLSKMELILPIARALFENSYLVPSKKDEPINYCKIARNSLRIAKAPQSTTDNAVNVKIDTLDTPSEDDDSDNPFEL